MKASLSTLQASLVSAPENLELLLLTGLVAHYAHNVDVEGAADVAMAVLEKARVLAPGDARPTWFLGIHQCQVGLMKEGMERLLSVESSLPWERLPATFWDDYLDCANLTNMPAHVLRAAKRAALLDPTASDIRSFQMEIAGRRLIRPDPAANYDGKQVWSGETREGQVLFTSFLFGLEFEANAEWKVQLNGAQKGTGFFQLQAGPYPGKAGRVFPNILILVRPAQPGESLADFLGAFTKNVTSKPLKLASCPSTECLAVESMQAGMYKEEGDGHAIFTAFRRDAPEFTGLLFEKPQAPPTSGNETAYFRPVERMCRFEGSLFYLVMLDVAASALEPAKAEYETVVKSIRVE